MSNSLQAAQLSPQLHHMRDVMRTHWGARYSAKVTEWQSAITNVADCQHVQPLEAALQPADIVIKAEEAARIKNEGRFMGLADGDPVTMHYVDVSTSQSPFHQVHARLSVDGEQAGYAISEAALRHTPIAVLAQRIGEQMAHFLLRELRDGRRVRPHVATPKDC